MWTAHSNYFVGKKCDVRLKQDNLLLGIGFNKPGGFYSVIVESISNDKVIVNDSHKCKHTARLSDILYIKECWKDSKSIQSNQR